MCSSSSGQYCKLRFSTDLYKRRVTTPSCWPDTPSNGPNIGRVNVACPDWTAARWCWAIHQSYVILHWPGQLGLLCQWQGCHSHCTHVNKSYKRFLESFSVKKTMHHHLNQGPRRSVPLAQWVKYRLDSIKLCWSQIGKLRPNRPPKWMTSSTVIEMILLFCWKGHIEIPGSNRETPATAFFVSFHLLSPLFLYYTVSNLVICSSYSPSKSLLKLHALLQE